MRIAQTLPGIVPNTDLPDIGRVIGNGTGALGLKSAEICAVSKHGAAQRRVALFFDA
jgi:hypothetical protein